MQTHKAMTTSYLVIHPAVVNPVIITVACKPVQACNMYMYILPVPVNGIW